MNSTDSSIRLVDKAHWDRVHTEHPPEALLPAEDKPIHSWHRIKLFQTIRKYLAAKPGQRVMEIGCAPGQLVLDFARAFDCEAHGIDYSDSGILEARKNFAAAGVPAGNALLGDLFDESFQASLAGQFDIVLSCGFIEHFTELPPVIEAHAGMLRPGGTLIVTIPNYSGLNHMLGMPTVGHLYPIHNLTLMNPPVFERLFEGQGLEKLWCGPCGGFDFGMFDNGGESGRLKTMRLMQAVLDRAFPIVHPPETRWTSPSLLYIGRKKA